MSKEAKINGMALSDIDPYVLFDFLIDALRLYKPNDRSPQDRAYAVVITDLEHVKAYFKMYILDSKTAVLKEPGSQL